MVVTMDPNRETVEMDVDVNLLQNQLRSCAYDTTIVQVTMKKEGSSHANIMLFDRKNHIIEHFDPHGESSRYEDAHALIARFMHDKFPEWAYIAPSMLCPAKGPQHAEHLGANFNKTGYCVSWSLYYMVLRLLNQNKTYEETYQYLATHPGIFFEIRRFRCFVLEIALANSSKDAITDTLQRLLNHMPKNIGTN